MSPCQNARCPPGPGDVLLSRTSHPAAYTLFGKQAKALRSIWPKGGREPPHLPPWASLVIPEQLHGSNQQPAPIQVPFLCQLVMVTGICWGLATKAHGRNGPSHPFLAGPIFPLVLSWGPGRGAIKYPAYNQLLFATIKPVTLGVPRDTEMRRDRCPLGPHHLLTVCDQTWPPFNWQVAQFHSAAASDNPVIPPS